MHENRETSRLAMSERTRTNSPAGEGQGRTTRAYDLEGSDSAVVPMKSPNNARGPMKGSAVEVMEGRAGAKENCEGGRNVPDSEPDFAFEVPRAMRWPPILAARANIQGRSRMR